MKLKTVPFQRPTVEYLICFQIENSLLGNSVLEDRQCDHSFWFPKHVHWDRMHGPDPETEGVESKWKKRKKQNHLFTTKEL